MSNPYITIKIWRKTKTLAKVLAERNGETLVKFLDRVVKDEKKRMNKSTD